MWLPSGRRGTVGNTCTLSAHPPPAGPESVWTRRDRIPVAWLSAPPANHRGTARWQRHRLAESMSAIATSARREGPSGRLFSNGLTLGSCAQMTARASNTTNELIQHRRDIADLEQRINNRRLQVFGLFATPIALIFAILSWICIKVFLYLHADTPGAINGGMFACSAFFCLGTIVQFAIEFSRNSPWRDDGTPVKDLRLELELTEEKRILEARRLTPPASERQASYKERLPAEIARLRSDSRHYRRIHLTMQWILFITSSSITAVTAWFNPPQPASGILIVLGFTVTIVTAASGYFKPRERAFNLQQTADNIEQHATAIELGISPYGDGSEDANLRSFATTVEALRAEQRMREQQLDQPQQGQQEVI